jgi:MtN3 and saliva related transmembrane protein
VTASELLGTAALIAGLLMAVAPALQVRRMLQTRSSRDFSLAYPTLLAAGFVLWLAYGISIWNPPMMISNTASLTFILLTIGVALRFRKADPS